MDFHTVLGDTVAGAQDFLYRAGIDVHASHHQHVVGASQYPTGKRHLVTAAGAGAVCAPLHQIPCPIAQQRRSDPAEIGQHKLTAASRRNSLAAIGIDHLGDEAGFDDVQHVGPRRTSVAHRTGFCHAMMIHHTGAVP